MKQLETGRKEMNYNPKITIGINDLNFIIQSELARQKRFLEMPESERSHYPAQSECITEILSLIADSDESPMKIYTDYCYDRTVREMKDIKKDELKEAV